VKRKKHKNPRAMINAQTIANEWLTSYQHHFNCFRRPNKPWKTLCTLLINNFCQHFRESY